MDSVPDKRERIIAAASRLIVRNGLQCSMQAIAEEAGVATGSLYNYFVSKEELVLGVYGRVAAEMAASLSKPHDPGSTHEERLRGYIVSYIDFIWEDALRARLFDYLDNNPLITIEDAQAIFGPFVDYAVDMIAGAHQAGIVQDGSPTLMASFVRGAIRNTLKRRRLQPDPLTAAEHELIAGMCWRAIAVG